MGGAEGGGSDKDGGILFVLKGEWGSGSTLTKHRESPYIPVCTYPAAILVVTIGWKA